VKAFAVEQWLKTLTLAPKSRNHIKTIMLNVFECAMRWEMVSYGRNPMSLVRVPGCSKRRKAPRVLSAAECQKLLAHLQAEPYRTMLMVAMSLGLRCSEWAALQWQDVDFDAGTISINRAIVVNRVDEVKTAYSGKTLPLHPMLASALCEQRNRSLWTGPGDWIFANPQSGGTNPYQPWKYAAKKMKEAAIQAGLGEGIGWHTFRHSYSSMLRDLQVDVKVQQELLRHADVRTTLNVYTQGVPENLRTANDLVVSGVLTRSIQ
jgi:integrase